MLLSAQPPQLSVPPHPSDTLPQAFGAQVAGVQPGEDTGGEDGVALLQTPLASRISPTQHALRFLLVV